MTLSCCSNVFAIAGIVCSIVSLTRWQREPESARNLNRWAWIGTGGGLVLMALLFAGYIAFAVAVGLGDAQ